MLKEWLGWGGTLVRLVSRTPSAGSFSGCRATADGGGG